MLQRTVTLLVAGSLSALLSLPAAMAGDGSGEVAIGKGVTGRAWVRFSDSGFRTKATLHVSFSPGALREAAEAHGLLPRMGEAAVAARLPDRSGESVTGALAAWRMAIEPARRAEGLSYSDAVEFAGQVKNALKVDRRKPSRERVAGILAGLTRLATKVGHAPEVKPADKMEARSAGPDKSSANVASSQDGPGEAEAPECRLCRLATLGGTRVAPFFETP